MSDSPVSSPVQLLTTPPSEKPLPSPPVAQLAKTSPMKEARSLIDASEKPLRRSPPGMPHKQEDWPVLSPQRVTATYSSQIMSDHGKLPASSTANERYHEFDVGYPPAPLIGGKSATKLSPSHNIRRKQIPPAKPHDQHGTASKPSKTKGKSDKHVDVTTTFGFAEPSTREPPNLSSSVITTNKSAYELAASLGHPRQTRTSSLRARLSADQQMKDTSDIKTRVVGFADLTSVNEAPRKPGKDSFSVRGESGTRSQGALATNLLKSSAGSMHANRAPAQFVGGSRRPHPHRPSSRSSLRSDSRARVASPTLQPPKRPAPAIPISSEVLDPEKIAEAESSKSTESRRSSIPVFRHTVSSLNSSSAENGIASVNTKLENNSRVNDGPRKAFDIVKDHTAKPLSFNHNEETSDKSTGDQPELTASKNTLPYPSNLQAIEESPRQGYHIKRLSAALPEIGPTLKISPDAERLIMGGGIDKENESEYQPVKGKDLPDSFRISNRHGQSSGTGSVADLKQRLERPSSSQGFSKSASRFGLVSNEWREKKVRSAELSNSLSTDRLHQHSAKPKTPHVRKSAEISVDDDPFFDAHSTLGKDQAKVVTPTALVKDPTSDKGKVTTEKAPWISPLSDEHHDLSKGKAALVADPTPPTFQNQLRSGSYADQKISIVANSAKKAADVEQMLLSGEILRSNDDAENPLPSTPERSRDSNNSASSSFPPRSSSRTTQPDYTVNGSAKLSPNSPSERELPASKEFLLRHNQLGASKGHASCPVDISQGAGAKRDSAARDSTQSQNSTSKGMLSNIRGLFHKRSSDNEPYSVRSSKKFKPTTSIGPSGSPFPPISEVHPLHRPTLASNNRRVIKDFKPITVDTHIGTPATPSFASPLPSEISTTTTLAMQLLESARTERSSPKKERALELGTIMVEAITQARNAEKAMEEAKQAARRAEVAYALCKKAVGDVSRRVLEWRDEFCE